MFASPYSFFYLLQIGRELIIINAVMKMAKKKQASSCLSCENFEYDEDIGAEVCVMELDEDELYRLSDREARGCPFYRLKDEYRIVRKQN